MCADRGLLRALSGAGRPQSESGRRDFGHYAARYPLEPRRIETTGLLAQSLARQQAKDAGADEAWMVDGQGFVTEGASCNAWIVTADGNLVTRPAEFGILRGITREVVMDLARSERSAAWKSAPSRSARQSGKRGVPDFGFGACDAGCEDRRRTGGRRQAGRDRAGIKASLPHRSRNLVTRRAFNINSKIPH